MAGVRGKLPRDKSYNAIQVFTPYKVMAVVAAANVTFATSDIAFRVTEDINYTVDGGSAVTLLAGTITGIMEGIVYTFAANSNIEVM